MDIDTSAAAVERLARLYDDAGLCSATSQHPSHAHTAATLRRLLAERDEWRASAIYRGENAEIARAIGSQALRGGPFVVDAEEG